MAISLKNSEDPSMSMTNASEIDASEATVDQFEQ